MGNSSILLFKKQSLIVIIFRCQPYFPSGSQKLVKSEFFTCELLEEISKVNYVIRRIRISPSQEFVTPTLIDSNDLSVTQDRIVYHYQVKY